LTPPRRAVDDAKRNWQNVTDDRIKAEGGLQSLQAKRREDLEKELTIQEKSLDVIKNAAHLLSKNISLYDTSGKPLDKFQIDEQKKPRSAALDTIVNEGFKSKDLDTMGAMGLAKFALEFRKDLVDSPVDLKFQVENGIQSLRDQIQTSFDTFKVNLGFNVEGMEGFLGEKFNNPDAMLNGIKEIRKREEFPSGVDNLRADQLKKEIMGTLAVPQDWNRTLARHVGFNGSEGSQIGAELNAGINQGLTGKVDLNELFGKLTKLKDLAISGSVAKNVGLSLDVGDYSNAFMGLKQLQDLREKQGYRPEIHSELKSINSRPAQSQPTTQNINLTTGDFIVNESKDAKMTAREIIAEIKRELRRGTATLGQ
jgi:hypothetical protein